MWPRKPSRRSTPAGAWSRPASSTSTRTTTRRRSGTPRSRLRRLHGVTTVIGGNCGFSIAPLAPDAGDYLMKMLARVEGMPLESLGRACRGTGDFGEYLDRLDGKLAVNAGFLVGHSALRRVVMGERRARQRSDARRAITRWSDCWPKVSLRGGLGFSSSWAATHNDGDGRAGAVASREPRRADRARAACPRPGTTLEFIPTIGLFGEHDKDLMAASRSPRTARSTGTCSR